MNVSSYVVSTCDPWAVWYTSGVRRDWNQTFGDNMDEITLTLSEKDINILLNALSYQHWNDRELTNSEQNYIDGFYQALESLVEVTSAS